MVLYLPIGSVDGNLVIHYVQTFSSVGQSPCTVTAYMKGSCNGGVSSSIVCICWPWDLISCAGHALSPLPVLPGYNHYLTVYWVICVRRRMPRVKEPDFLYLSSLNSRKPIAINMVIDSQVSEPCSCRDTCSSVGSYRCHSALLIFPSVRLIHSALQKGTVGTPTNHIPSVVSTFSLILPFPCRCGFSPRLS